MTKTNGVYTGKYIGRDGCYQQFEDAKQWIVEKHIWRDSPLLGIHARNISDTIHLR